MVQKRPQEVKRLDCIPKAGLPRSGTRGSCGQEEQAETRPDGSTSSLCPQKRASSQHLELGELAAFLGRVDPWYESTVNTLCSAIQKLAEMVGARRASRVEGGIGSHFRYDS